LAPEEEKNGKVKEKRGGGVSDSRKKGRGDQRPSPQEKKGKRKEKKRILPAINEKKERRKGKWLIFGGMGREGVGKKRGKRVLPYYALESNEKVGKRGGTHQL